MMAPPSSRSGAPGREGSPALAALILLACASALPACTLPSPLNPALRGTLGSPSDGMQTAPSELPKAGVGFRRYRPWSDKHWARPRLVRAISEAAAAVHQARPDTPPKLVGDLSARHGGKIPHHASHRTGRDVDLLFYATTPAGVPVASPGFVHYGADGLAYDKPGDRYVRFDVEREWLFIKALLASPHIGVQWMFISRELEALLIEHALARGEDLDLIWHAETVLLQPGDSANHDDHIHLRIACEPREIARGCVPGGPHWDWLAPLPRPAPFTDAELAAIAVDTPPLPPILAEPGTQALSQEP